MTLSDLPDSEVGEQDVLLESHPKASWGWKRAVGALVAGAGIIAVAGFSSGSRRQQWAVQGAFSVLASDDHEFEHMSDECVQALLDLEKETEKHEGEDVECDEDHMQCDIIMSDKVVTSKCFPGGGVCKGDNIMKELQMPPGMEGKLACQDGDDKTEHPFGGDDEGSDDEAPAEDDDDAGDDDDDDDDAGDDDDDDDDAGSDDDTPADDKDGDDDDDDKGSDDEAPGDDDEGSDDEAPADDDKGSDDEAPADDEGSDDEAPADDEGSDDEAPADDDEGADDEAPAKEE